VSVPVDNALENNSIFLNIFLRNYDDTRLSVDILSQARQDYFTTGKRLKRKVCLTVDGEKHTYNYIIDAKGKFKWHTYIDGVLTEQAYMENDGYRIECNGLNGSIIKKIHFNNDHIWQKTEYFDGDENQPVHIYLPWLSDDKAAIAAYEKMDDIPEILFSLRMPLDTNMQKRLINTVNPAVSAITNCGFSYFANPDDEKQWDDMLKSLLVEYDKPKLKSDVNEDVIEDVVDDTVYFNLESLKEKNNTNDFTKTNTVFGGQFSFAQPHDSVISMDNQISLNPYDNANAVSQAIPYLENDCDDFESIEKMPEDNSEADKAVNISARQKGLYYGSLDEAENRHGYGRTQTDSGKTVYDGQYHDDKRSGFGVSYFKTGKISYVGNWDNDKQHGFGIEFRATDGSVSIGRFNHGSKKAISSKYDKNGNLMSVTNTFDENSKGGVITFNQENGNMLIAPADGGKQTVNGTVINAQGYLIYKGEFKNNCRDGNGTAFNNDGTVKYQGGFKKDKYSGNGILYLSDSVISGEFSSGTVNGKAVEKNSERIIYDGYWKDGLYNGEGTLYNNDKTYIIGTFKSGSTTGVVSLFDCDGNILYLGNMINGVADGKGELYLNGEKTYEGNFFRGKKCGKGKQFKNGRLIYDGTFDNDEYCDYGISYENDVQTYSGMWHNDKYNGKGVLYINNEVCIVGDFTDGVANGRINKIVNDVLIAECIYANGQCEYARLYSNDGSTLLYEGNIKDNKKEGMGCTFSQYGEKTFEGIFKDDEPFKNMKIITRELKPLELIDALKGTDYEKYCCFKEFAVEVSMLNGVYSGAIKKDMPHGKGTILFSDHRYTGEFENGKPLGHGVLYYGDGTVASGQFVLPTVAQSETITFSDATYYCIIDKKEE